MLLPEELYNAGSIHNEPLTFPNRFNLKKSVLRIHDILGWIRILGLMPRLMDPDPAFFVTDLPDASEKLLL
jgi:hypothetical protein